MKGYKATDKDMKCKGFQFELGKWFEHEGDLKLCESGFHFCPAPSGPWCYYDDPGDRIFEVEAEDVLETPVEPRVDFKRVCRRIRFIKEVFVNTRKNSGSFNSGSYNSGSFNSGSFNSGDSNNGDSNNGDFNSGSFNSGSYNSGSFNSGSRNSGSYNSGNSNSGSYNATNRSAGFFCVEEPKVISFDVQTNLGRDDFLNAYPEAHLLGKDLQLDDPIEFEKYKNIPGITEEKLRNLHNKFKEGRKKNG